MDQHNSENMISERQRQILRVIVEEYVGTARPVASEHIVSRYDLTVSSATIRNEMAELERAGLIMQPHTSAGRVPSDKGYRYFVENLMNPAALPADEQRKIDHQFHQVEMDAQEWVRLAASVLARTVHNAAVATPPRSIALKLKHFELLSISDTRLMIVAVGHDGTVTQQIMNCDEGTWDQAALSSLAAQLNARLEGKTADEIAAWGSTDANTRSLSPLAIGVVGALASMLKKLGRTEVAHVYHEGLGHILGQPEFRDPERMQRVLELFEQGGLWSALLPSVINQDGVQVIIGDEAWGDGIGQLGVVLARYGMGDRMAGVLGVIGPVRMPYSRSVSTVSYMSRLLSNLLDKSYSTHSDEKGEI